MRATAAGLRGGSVRHEPRGRACATEHAERENNHRDDGSRRPAERSPAVEDGFGHGTLAQLFE